MLMCPFSNLHTRSSRDAKNFLKTHNFDGIDLDYEFPVAGDKDNFGLFVKELREGLGDKYELTAATSATPSKIAGNFQKVSKLAFACTYIQFLILIFSHKIQAGYPVSIMNQYMDAWHLMSYDMHGSWEGKS